MPGKREKTKETTNITDMQRFKKITSCNNLNSVYQKRFYLSIDII